MKRSLRTVLCEESPNDLTNVVGPFSVILQPSNFYKVEFTYTSGAGKIVSKTTKMLQSFGF